MVAKPRIYSCNSGQYHCINNGVLWQVSFLVTSDLHLTDKDIDSYRWGLFPWLKEQLVTHQVEYMLILGDITDAKDKHSAQLTNRIVESITSLTDTPVKQVICLRGNHDYIDQQTPFFKFLSNIPKVRFVIAPWFLKERLKTGMKELLFLPNSRNPLEDWGSELKLFNVQDYIFMHQTVGGSLSENGTPLEGVSAALFDHLDGMVISGDVHVPQLVAGGKVMYVGSPYHVHFGDSFIPRVLLVNDDDEFIDLHYPTVRRHTLDIHTAADLERLNLPSADQVKIRITLDDVLEWDKVKVGVLEWCKSKGVVVHECTLQKSSQETNKKYTVDESILKNLSPAEILAQYFSYAKVKQELTIYAEHIIKER